MAQLSGFLPLLLLGSSVCADSYPGFSTSPRAPYLRPWDGNGGWHNSLGSYHLVRSGRGSWLLTSTGSAPVVAAT